MKIRHYLLPVLFLAVAPPAVAQEPEPLDSIRARLERAERMIDVLQTQVAEQAESKVEPAAGGRIELFGHILLNGFSTSAKVLNSDVPLFVQPPDPPGGLPVSGVGASLRQTRVGIRAFHSDVLGSDLSGEVEFNLFGGHLGDGRLRPLVSLRRARVELRWPQAWLVFGHEAPPISGENPSSLAALDLPGFSTSGNLWFWIPQVRFGFESPTVVRVGFEVSALAPFSAGQPTFVTNFTAAERSDRPMVEGRLLARWGDPQIAGGEVSLGGHWGWIATDGDSLLSSKAAAFAARFFVTEYVEVRGEAFTGEATAVLGGGGVGQLLGAGGFPVRTKGGWGQLNLLPVPEWEFGGGFGIDDPDDADFAPNTGRLQNKSWETHILWRPHPLMFGLEVRRLFTLYGDPAVGTQVATHVNLAMGFRF
jgi:hypothetical protein